jgi:hypothetical protein
MKKKLKNLHLTRQKTKTKNTQPLIATAQEDD